MLAMFDGGLIAEEVRDRRGSPDQIASRERDRAIPGFVAVPVEPRFQIGRATDGVSRSSEGVSSLAERDELSVEVADGQDRGFLEAGLGFEQLVEDASAGIDRARDAHQEGDGGRQVDGADARHRPLLVDARASRHEGGVHVDVRRQINRLRQVTVLAEELGEGDRLPKVAASNW